MLLSNLQPAFKIDLGHKVKPKLVTIAKYDGTHPCLTACAGFDKVIIHHPHTGSISRRAQRSTTHGEVSELNLSQEVVALAAGPISVNTARDILIIGSPEQILAYDVHDNTDLFYKDAQDGVNVIITGILGKTTTPIAIIGGNSSVHGLDHEGNEVFWTVVGGKVCSLMLFDFDRDGENELIVGCEDFSMRVLKNNQFIAEIAETGQVLVLTPISINRFTYGLDNGTIGIYEDGSRLWRVKSKQIAVSLQWSGDTLACCWSNGRVDWRDGESGRVIRRVQMRSNAVAMMLADYRSIGSPDLVCVSDRGEVLGYPPPQKDAPDFNAPKATPSEKDRQAITELFNRKQALMIELQHYEANVVGDTGGISHRETNYIPVNTRILVSVSSSVQDGCLDLMISTNNETIVRTVLILAEGMFENGETLARHPDMSDLKSRLFIALKPPRDVPVDVHIKALVGFPDSKQYHIFEMTKHLPRFSMYALNHKTPNKHEASYVTFRITERLQRICLWIKKNFLMEEEIGGDDVKDLKISFVCLRDSSNLHLVFDSSGQVWFYTKSLKLAGDLVQSLAEYLKLNDLQSTAHFPETETQIREELSHVSQINETRSRLAAETAERAQLITAILPAAQDAASYNLNLMLTQYKEVILLNEELLAGCLVRRSHHEQSTLALTTLHSILQQASRIRVGKHSKAVVTASRNAVKEDNVDALIKTLQVGDSI